MALQLETIVKLPTDGSLKSVKDGNGTLVLIHGMTSAFPTFLNVMQPLADTLSIPVVGVNLRGHGASPEPADVSQYSNAECAKDVAAALGALGVLDKKGSLIVLGHSWGSRTAFQFGVDYSKQLSGKLLVISEDEYARADTAEKIASRSCADLKEVVAKAEKMRQQWVPTHKSFDDCAKWLETVAGAPEFWGFEKSADNPTGFGRKIGQKKCVENDGENVFFSFFKPHADLAWNYFCMHDDYSDVLADPAKFKFAVHIQCGSESCGADVSDQDYRAMLEVAQTNPSMRSVTRIDGAGHVVHREKTEEFLDDIAAAVKRFKML